MVIVLLVWSGWSGLETLAAEFRAEAYRGHPFGIARIVIERPDTLPWNPLGRAGIAITGSKGRVLYPVIDTGVAGPIAQAASGLLLRSRRPALRMLGQLIEQSPKVELYFLFVGDDSLDIAFNVAPGVRMRVYPEDNQREYEDLLEDWWELLTERPAKVAKYLPHADFPRQVQTYLECMLAMRLGLPLGPVDYSDSFQRFAQEQLGLLLGRETWQVRLIRERFCNKAYWLQQAELPLPDPIDFPPLEPSGEVPPDRIGNVPVEAIAKAVPQECFYVRFGTYSNFLWIQDLLARWGGDLQSLVALRSISYDTSEKLQRRLLLKQSVLSRLLGRALIVDVALIGTDLYFQDGPAVGFLFQARNDFLLGTNLRQQRSEALANDSSLVEKTLLVCGRKVSFITSSDGSVRSYYVADKGFHLVTTSRRLVERFLEALDGENSLADSLDFRLMRHRYPLERDDVVFAYFSDAFWRNFTSPKYRVETIRRMQAAVDIQLVKLARLAAGAEGRPNETIEQLVAGGFLPPWFGIRPDGSKPVLNGDEVYDSLRGWPGNFIPVPDIEVNKVSEYERQYYAAFGRFCRTYWERLDPVVIAIRRVSEENNIQRLAIDIRVTPLSKANYRCLLQDLGRPTSDVIRPAVGDVVWFNLSLRDGLLFGALREIRLPEFARAEVSSEPPELSDVTDELLLRSQPLSQWFRLRDMLVGYLGGHGEPWPLQWFDVGMRTRRADPRMARNVLGLWRVSIGDIKVYSFQPEVLQIVTPQLSKVTSEHPAHFRLIVLDPSKTQAADRFNRWAYIRGRQSCLGNLRLLWQLHQQLGVPIEKCPTTAEDLLQGRLRCPLGGTFRLESNNGIVFWNSDKLPLADGDSIWNVAPPTGFSAPPFNWFRGLHAIASAEPDAIEIHVDLSMTTFPTGTVERK